MIKYAIHPQIIRSSIDGQTHYIGYIELIKLYELDPQECILWNDSRPEMNVGRNFNDYIHLYAKPDENYKP